MSIEIRENGWAFVMNAGQFQGDSCEGCPAYKKCRDGLAVYSMCYGSETHHCTSATKITEEATIHSSISPEKATHLIGKRVEFSDDCKEWFVAELDKIDISASHYSSNGCCYEYIREIPTRPMTWPELCEEYKIADNVVLVEVP